MNLRNNTLYNTKGAKLRISKFNPNTVWVIVLMSFVIVLLLGFIFSERTVNADSIKVFIDYAATLLSITLSIFAIAFTYTSNNSTQRQFDKIDYASMKIVDSANKLHESERDISMSMKLVHEKILNIEKDMALIKDKIPNIISASAPEVDSSKSNKIT